MATNRFLSLTAAVMLALILVLGKAQGEGVYFATTSLPDAMVGVYYHTRVEVTGEDIPYEITLTENPSGDNEFPPELTITTDGVIYGTPLTAGVYPFSLQVAFGVDTTRFCVLKLVVKPYDESALDAGVGDPKIVGVGNDTLVGVANGVNGGRVAMEFGKNTAYFVDDGYMLLSSKEPYKKTEEMFGAPEYRWLDSIGTNLYYFHRYYQKAEPVYTHYVPGKYITRIVRDPIYSTGRETLVDLNKKNILDLAVTDRVVVYILGEDKGLLKRVPLEGGLVTTIRCYSMGMELTPDRAFPYNGYAYLRDWSSKFLYRVPLDGEVAVKLTERKAVAFTICRFAGEDTLFYAGTAGAVYHMPPEGGSAVKIAGIKASTLNSDAEFLFYANMDDGNRLYRVSPDSPENIVKLSDYAVDQIYVFDNMAAFQKQGGTELYVLPKDGSEAAARLGK